MSGNADIHETIDPMTVLKTFPTEDFPRGAVDYQIHAVGAVRGL